jgi:hypothetical protein
MTLPLAGLLAAASTNPRFRDPLEERLEAITAERS